MKYIFQSIGGFIRWIVFRKKSLQAYDKNDWEGNHAAFLLTVALVTFIIILATVLTRTHHDSTNVSLRSNTMISSQFIEFKELRFRKSEYFKA